MAMITDEALVEQAQQGDQESLNELLDRYERKTYTLAYRLMGNHADACDASQEALVRIFTRLHNFRGEAAFSTWLFRVVTNTCLDELRRRGRLRHTSLDDPFTSEDGLLPRESPSDLLSPIERAEQSEVQAAVHRAVSRLPEEYRVVVTLRDLQDHSYHEIATMLDTSLGTIKSRLHRARQALRSILRATEAHKLDIAG